MTHPALEPAISLPRSQSLDAIDQRRSVLRRNYVRYEFPMFKDINIADADVDVGSDEDGEENESENMAVGNDGVDETDEVDYVRVSEPDSEMVSSFDSTASEDASVHATPKPSSPAFEVFDSEIPSEPSSPLIENAGVYIHSDSASKNECQLSIPVSEEVDAALLAYVQLFPQGHEIIDTPTTGLLCGFHAVIRSMEALYPCLPQPTVASLRKVMGSEEFVEHARAFGMRNKNSCTSFHSNYI